MLVRCESRQSPTQLPWAVCPSSASSTTEPFPPEFNNDSAFFDRIHCYLPGWEVPKMRADLLTDHYGLITDCLSEFCKGMRRRDYTHHLDGFFRTHRAL